MYEQSLEWRIRGAQSNENGHGNSPTIIDEYADYKTVTAEPFDIYKQVSPYDSLLFPLISEASLGDWYIGDHRFQTIEHIDRGQSTSQSIPRVPFFEGIDFIPDEPVSITTAFELAAEYAKQGETVNQILTTYFEIFQVTTGEARAFHRARFRESMAVALSRWDKKGSEDLELRIVKNTQIIEAAEQMLLNDIQPTWTQLDYWTNERVMWSYTQMDSEALDGLKKKRERYKEKAKEVDIEYWKRELNSLYKMWHSTPQEEAHAREQECITRITNYQSKRTKLMKRYNLDANGVDALLAMKLDIYGYDHRNYKPLKPNYTLPVHFSGSVYFEFMFDESGNMILGEDGHPLVQTITISPRFSEKGFFEDAYGAKVIRGRGA